MTPRPKQQEESKNWIVRLFKAMNSNWASRIFSIVVIGLIISGYVFYLTSKFDNKKEDCSICENKVKILVDVLTEVKQEMNNLAKGSISSNLRFNSGITITFPFIDTFPEYIVADKTGKVATTPSMYLSKKELKEFIRISDSINRIDTTLPKKKAKVSAKSKAKVTVPSLQKQQIEVAAKVILKIDSALRQVQQQQKQTKN